MLRIVDGDLALAEFGQALGEQSLHEELLFDPDRHGREEAAKAAGREHMICLEQPLEFQKRLVVERHRGKVFVFEASFLEHKTASIDRERRVVLPPREAFFLCGGNNLAVDEERRGTIVVVGRYAEDCFFHRDPYPESNGSGPCPPFSTICRETARWQSRWRTS